MNEEEKKAIEEIEEFIEDDEIENISVFTAKKIRNIIDKQQKEIEEKNIAINKMSKDISRQLEEIEEKTTILLAGAEKVKQLEKGNRSLMESRIKWKNRYYKEKEKNKECISKDEVREKIKELETLYNCNLDTALTSYEMFVFVRSYIDKVKNILNGLLEDN